MTTKSVTIVAATMMAAFTASAALAQPYTISRIGTSGDRDIRATDINDIGQVVGFSLLDDAVFNHAFLYDGTAMTSLEGFNPGDKTVATAINNNGQVVGRSIDDATSERTAVLWDSGAIINIGADLKAADSIARDINDNGVVVGQAAEKGSPFSDGFIWDSINGGQMVGTLEGRNGGANRSVNNLGIIVGHSFFFGSPDQAHLITKTDDVYTSTLISAPFPGIGVAAAINNHDMIGGHANTTFGPHTAALFTPGELDLFTDLGTLPGATGSEAFDINDSGTIVGTAVGNSTWATSHAFVFTDGKMHDLNDRFVDSLGEWDVLIQASAINKKGDIVGFGRTLDGNTAAFFLAVPEPSSALLLLLGVIAACRYTRPTVAKYESRARNAMGDEA